MRIERYLSRFRSSTSEQKQKRPVPKKTEKKGPTGPPNVNRSTEALSRLSIRSDRSIASSSRSESARERYERLIVIVD